MHFKPTIRNCERCGSGPLRSDQMKYCSARCYRGGEFRLEFLRRMAASSTKDTCTIWPYSTNASGYGTVREGLVHRIAHIEFVGPLTNDECALHNCDNPPCFNPHHLFKGSRDDNNKDRVVKGRSATGMRNPSCKLSPEQVRDILDQWTPYKNGRELAEKHGVTMTQVREIARGLSQFHLIDAEEKERRRGNIRVNRNRGVRR